MWDLIWGVLVIGPPTVAAGIVLAPDVAHALWMRSHDRPAVPYRPLPVATPQTRAQIEGWSGTVVDGELVTGGR